MPVIILETKIKAKKEIIFDLARDMDLHQLSTAKTNESAIAGKTTGLLELNETVTWRAKHFGIYQNLTSKMTVLEKPDFFVDEMVKGAFKSFTHEHYFENIQEGTLMKDIFTYQSPSGILGKLADYLFLKKYMTNLLLERNAVIKEFVESNKWKENISSNHH